MAHIETIRNTVNAPHRMLIAFLENNDGTILIPEALRLYMVGKEKIEKK